MVATIQTILKPTRARGLDTSGNNNHAQIYSGRALEFDGVTDYLSVTGAAAGKTFVDYSAETTAANRAWTVAVWLNYDAASSSHQMITGRDNSADSCSSNHIRLTNTEKIGFYDIGGGASRTGNTVLQPKTWYRAVFVYNGSDTVNFYLNGVADGSGALASSDANNNADLNISLIGGSITSSELDKPFAGKMSDFQAWQGAWTTDDVEYDYLNPEQLVLNRGGTSLTNSNLKLWYPMNDGHRGNQSYVLDASNTGLGDEMATNGDFSNGSTGWTTSVSNDSTVTISGGGATITNDGTTGYGSLAQASVTFDANQVYKLTFDITAIDLNGGAAIGVYDYNSDANKLISSHSATGSVTSLINSDGTDGIDVRAIVTNGQSITLDNISVKPVNNKHNATTVFFGDEQISATNDRTFAGASNWTNRSSSNAWDTYNESASSGATEGTYFTDNYLHLAVTSDASNNKGAYLDGANWEDVDGDAPAMVVGRTYRLSYSIEITAYTSGTLSIGMANASNTMDTNSDKTYTATKTAATDYFDFVYAGTTDHAIIMINATASSAFTVYFDNFSLKEVGVATGWTDADQQLDIPQTALQSYSLIPYNFTKGGSSSTSHFYTCDASVGTVVNNSFTLSMWLFSHDEDSGTQFLFAVADRDAGSNVEESFAIKWLTNGNLQFSYEINGGGDVHSTTGQIFDSNDLGKWFHFAISHNYSNDTTSIYKNGELIAAKDHSTTMDLNIGGGNTQLDVHWGDASSFKGANLKGAMNEMSVWNTNLSQSQILEIYNNGAPLDCTTHSASSNLTNYWRNNGLAVWSDLAGSNNLTPTNFTETMLITAGVDSSRDSQGFFMNRQRTTNTLNLPLINIAGNTYTIGSSEIEIPNPSLTYSDTGFSVECWFKAVILGEPMFFICHQEGGNSAEGFHLRWAGGNVAYAVISDGTNEASEAIGGALNADQWYHIVASWDHSNKKKYVYIDGILRQVETESSMGTIAPNANIHIGTRRGEADQDFIGQIDDVKLYNRILTDGGVTTGQADSSSLSTAAGGEVLRNYNAGKRSHK